MISGSIGFELRKSPNVRIVAASKRVSDKAATEKVASEIRAKLKLGEFNLDEKKRTMPTFKVYVEGFLGTYSAMNHRNQPARVTMERSTFISISSLGK